MKVFLLEKVIWYDHVVIVSIVSSIELGEQSARKDFEEEKGDNPNEFFYSLQEYELNGERVRSATSTHWYVKNGQFMSEKERYPEGDLSREKEEKAEMEEYLRLQRESCEREREKKG